MSRRKKNRAVMTADAFSNPAARLGFGTLDLTQGTAYPLTRMSQNYQLLTSLYRDNWIVQNIVTTIPNDILRKWYDLKTAIDPGLITQFRRMERTTHLRQRLSQGFYWGRLYGGAAGLILIKGQEDLSEPLDIDSVMPGAFQGLMIVDRWNGIYPDIGTVKDPADPDFGLPEYYTIRDEERNFIAARVHHSRIVRFLGRELPWLESIAEQYWGESEIEAIFNEIVKRDNTSANIASLTFKANVNYMEADGLDQLLGTGNAEMQRRFWNLMQAQNVLESNFGLRILNKGDAIHNTQYTFTGIADAYDRIMMDVAGAARTPVTKLFGRSPAGMNATGESDMRNYYDYIDGLRETVFRPIIERLLPVMAYSVWGQIPDDLDIEFPEMETADPKELSEIAQNRANSVIAAYQTNLIDKGTALQELKACGDDTGVFGKISDDDIEAGKGLYYRDEQRMLDPMAGLFGQEPAETEEEETAGAE